MACPRNGLPGARDRSTDRRWERRNSGVSPLKPALGSTGSFFASAHRLGGAITSNNALRRHRSATLKIGALPCLLIDCFRMCACPPDVLRAGNSDCESTGLTRCPPVDLVAVAPPKVGDCASPTGANKNARADLPRFRARVQTGITTGAGQVGFPPRRRASGSRRGADADARPPWVFPTFGFQRCAGAHQILTRGIAVILAATQLVAILCRCPWMTNDDRAVPST
jgi:hypothetical protein